MTDEELDKIRDSNYNLNRNMMPIIFYDEIFVQVSTIIPEVEDRYYISNYGRLYDANRMVFISPYLQPNGYLSVTMNKKRSYYKSHNDHAYHITIHRLVCMAFCGIPENYKELQVNHKNSIRFDCYQNNLEWTTPKENVFHSFNQGNRKVGAESNRSVYTELEVRKICELMQSGIYDYDEICMTVFNHKCTDKEKALIYNIRNRLFWNSISCEYSFDPSPKKTYALSEEQVHSVCKILESDPSLMNPKNKSAANIIALKALGIDLHCIDQTESKRIRYCINNIKNKAIYKSICCQYNF